jgi:catechol 2,3-dioxygenase-like lactoylglutathione lyase family enzyme
VPSRAFPLLASPDLAATLAFYEALGFRSRGAPHTEWDYLIVVRDDVELHFAGPTTPATGPGACFIAVDDADALYDEWQARVDAPARLTRPIHTNYGMRAFTLFDPDGNEVRVGAGADGRTTSPVANR